MNWRDMNTDEKADAIRERHKPGWSATDLGAALGCTRHAIIGVYQRRPELKTTHPLRVANKDTAPKHLPTGPKVRKAKSMSGLHWKSTKVSPDPLPIEPAPPLEARRVRLHELERCECKWPVEEIEEGVHLFCGLPRQLERAYCDKHHALAYRGCPPTRLGGFNVKAVEDLMQRTIVRYGAMHPQNKRLTKQSIKA